MKKKLSFLIVALMAMVSFAWADPLVESSGNQGSSDTKISGTSYTLDGTFIAGKGGVQQGNMPDKGVKMRTNKGPVVFQVNKGFKITKLEFWGCGNSSTAVDIVSVTVDGGQNLLANTVTLPGKATDGASGDIVLSDIAAEDNITLTFKEGTTAQFVGTWKITYEQTEVIVQEITGVTLNGTALSDADLATLKSTKALTIDGSTLNGAGAVDVTLSSGSTTVTKSFDGTTALYKFTVSNEEYAITVRGVGKKYAENGLVAAYSVNGIEAEGANTKAVTMNGITFTMANDSKTFQYGSGNVTLSENVYVPLKLSTGSAVNVTFPEGKKATKVTVYGWSANGNGKLYAMKESADGEKSVDVSNDVYYATNTGDDIYPSVYEYDLDNWESLYFNPGGSPSQPFVVMDFTFAEETPAETNYYVVGSMNQWTASENYQLVANPGAEGEYMFTGDFEANTEIKVTSSEGAWYPDGQDNNYVIQEAGNYTIYFRPAGNVPDWYGGYFYVALNEEPIETNTYTATFTTDANWASVKAYAWTRDVASGQVTEFLGGWPGKDITETLAEGVYTLTFEAAAAPDSIIFSNGAGVQTEDFAFVNGGAYSFNKPVPTKYNVSIAEDIQNGTVTVDPTEYEAGQEVTVVATPAENYELEAITAVGKTTNEAIRVTDGKFTMIADDVIVSATFKEIPQLVGYFVVGSMNEWSYDEAYQMQESAAAQGIYEFTAQFAAKDEIKVKSMMSDKSFTWYPDNMDNFVIPQDGEYTITFNPAGGVEDWYGGFFNVVMKEEPLKEYSVQFVNGADWQQVYAYTWTGDGVTAEKVEQLGAWPGTEMTAIDTEAEIDGKKYPVYELKFTAAVEPDSIVFSNGRGGEVDKTQTADLEFVNEYQYALVIDDEPVNPDQKEEEIEFTAAGTGTNPMVYTKDHFTYTFDKGTGSTNPTYLSSAEETRLYAKGTLTIKAIGSEKIIGITYDAKLNANSKGVTPTIDGVAGKTNAGTWDAENWLWTGEDTEVTMTTSGTAGNVGFKGITVAYTDEGGGDQPVEIKTMAIVGDFLGLEATGESNNPNWDPANGWQMTQEDTNPNIWTLKKEGVVVEGKKYEYKATANGNWDDFVLPAGTENANFVFGTNEYPAGTYDLTFTANVEENTLTLVAEQQGVEPQPEVLTVAQAIALIDENQGATVKNVSVQGIISQIDKFDSRYGSITYWISDDGTTTNQFEVYSGLNKDGEKFTSKDDIEVGAKVVVTGDILLYNNKTYEFDKNNQLVSYEAPEPLAGVESMAINGTFPGMSWDADKGIAMTQDADNKAVWTLTMEKVVVEGQKYEYKAFANGKTDDYQLPAEGNNDFVFGTDKYPAGEYTLTFTANTATHSLTLDVKKNGINTIKELNAQDAGTEFSFVGNAIVVAKAVRGGSWNATNNNVTWVYIKDETGNSLIYDAYNGSKLYDIDRGNVITAPWTGKVSIYKNLFEVVPDEALTATSTVEVKIPEGTPGDVKAENVNKVVEMKGLTIDNVDDQNIKFTIGDALVAGYNQFLTPLPENYEGKTYDVVGAISIHDEDVQFCPITFTEAVAPEDVYTVAGAFYNSDDAQAICFGTTWDANAEANNMVLGADGIYTKNYTDVELTAGNIQFKVVKNHNWDTAYPEQNYAILVTKDGKYDLAITFNPETNEVTAQLTSDEPIEPQKYTASFTTDKDWQQVYAYIWKGNIAAPVEWPGKEITETVEDGVFTYTFESTYEPDFIIFNDGTSQGAVGESQTADLPFVDGTLYSLTTEKTTAWAGDPDEAIPATTGITIPAKTCQDAGVQTAKIIRIVAKELAAAAPARGLDNTVTGDPNDIPFSIVKIDGETELIADKDITVAEDLGAAGKAYEFTAEESVSKEMTDNGFVIKPKTEKNVAVAAIEVEAAKVPATVVPIDFAPAPTDDIGAVIEARAKEITDAGNKVGKITITLGAIGTPYTTTKSIVAPGDVVIQGAGAATSIIDASGLEGDLITLNGTEALAQKKDGTDSDHKLIASVEVNNLKIAGLKGALITDAQKTLLEKLTINNAVVEMPAAAKNVINFNGKGYVGEVVVKNSTIYANGMNTGFFAQYGSRPKNVNGDWFQTFDVQNSTFVNIANTKNFTNLKQNGTDHNKYILKNNIFVDCGKTNQVVVGFNNGQTSATPIWDVDNNVFNASGADGSAAEVEKAGKKGEEDIVKNSVAGVVTFTDAANGDFNGTFALGEGASEPATKPGDPRWTITYATPVVITTMSIVGEFTGGWPVQDPETSAWDWSMAKAMTQDAENANIWTLEMPFVAEAKKYEYKAAANSNWNDYVLPAGDNANFEFGTPEYPAGEYILTFTADTKNHTVGVVAKWNGPENIEISPESGDIAAALATAVEGKNVGNITINLKADGEYTIGSAMVAPGAFTVRGNGATVNVAAEFTGEAIVKMAASAEAPTAVTKVDYISFHDVTFKGLSKALFYSTQKKYDIEWFTIENCVLELTADATTIDFTKGSAARNINVVNSTIYAPTATTKSFYSSQGGEKMTEIDADGIQTFIFKNNTMYNLAPTKNFFTHRQANQKWLAYDVENNIFVNCGKSGQVIKGMNGGQGGANPTWTIIGNAFNFDGADTSAAESTGDTDHTGDETPGLNETVQNSVAGVVTFTDAANGDFNGDFKLAPEATAPAALGAPKWILNFVETIVVDKLYIMGNGTASSWDNTTEMTFNETTQAFEYDITASGDTYFTFGDAAFTDWADWNANHRYAIAAGDQPAEMNATYELVKVEGTVKVTYTGKLHVSVTKDLKMTLTPATGINGIVTDDADDNAPIYNLAGQKVGKNYKGVVIKNGKKVYQK